jgi:4-amino-4-deoxy-L-arabinose transferase-like glycosyltransferase
MVSSKIFRTILLFSFITMVINFVYFGDLSVDFVFLFGNFMVIVLCLSLMRWAAMHFGNLRPGMFIKKIFFLSLSLRIFSVFFLYGLFYYITGTKFDVEAIDVLWYHKNGLDVADLIRHGTFSFDKLIAISRGFDYIGYSAFLGIVYYLTGDSVIIARLIQALFGSFSVIVIYRIGSEVWNDTIGKNSAILAMAFPPLILLEGLHLRETFMVYFCLLFVLYLYRIVNHGVSWTRLFILVGSVFVLSTFRTALFAIVLFTLCVYFIISLDIKLSRKIIAAASLFLVFGVLSTNIAEFEHVRNKSMGYLGIETDVRLGGRSLAQYERKGISAAQHLSAPLMGVMSLSTPFPSMVKTNIKYYNQTLQWYYIGGLMIYGYLMFFGYLGIYESIKQFFKRQSIIIIYLFFHAIALVVSVYLFSIRFNMIKMTIALLFIGIGLSHFSKTKHLYFLFYCIFISIMMLAWNYTKLASRGWI